MQEKRYTIEELAEATGFSVRTIRYYIQEGLLDPPPGRGRGGYYFDSHLQRLRQIKALQEQGLKLSSIEQVLRKGQRPEIHGERDLWVRYSIQPGVEIHVSREVEEQERRSILEIIKIARSILQSGGR
jgi:DNA-binding transcriptional MerR regulator